MDAKVLHEECGRVTPTATAEGLRGVSSKLSRGASTSNFSIQRQNARPEECARSSLTLMVMRRNRRGLRGGVRAPFVRTVLAPDCHNIFDW